MLVGFGLRDSIMDIARRQYQELQHYTGTVAFVDGITCVTVVSCNSELSSPQEQLKSATAIINTHFRHLSIAFLVSFSYLSKHPKSTNEIW